MTSEAPHASLYHPEARGLLKDSGQSWGLQGRQVRGHEPGSEGVPVTLGGCPPQVGMCIVHTEGGDRGHFCGKKSCCYPQEKGKPDKNWTVDHGKSAPAEGWRRAPCERGVGLLWARQAAQHHPFAQGPRLEATPHPVVSSRWPLAPSRPDVRGRAVCLTGPQPGLGTHRSRQAGRQGSTEEHIRVPRGRGAQGIGQDPGIPSVTHIKAEPGPFQG